MTSSRISRNPGKGNTSLDEGLGISDHEAAAVLPADAKNAEELGLDETDVSL